MALPDTLIVGTTDLSTLTGVFIEDWSGLFAPGDRRGSDLEIPGRNGAIAVAGLPYAVYSFDVPITILPDVTSGPLAATLLGQRQQVLTNYRALCAALTPGVVTLTRRLARAAGPGYDEHTCQGRFTSGLRPQFFNAVSGATILTFLNLDGVWFDSVGAVVVP